jgi:hypothetical protein
MSAAEMKSFGEPDEVRFPDPARLVTTEHVYVHRPEIRSLSAACTRSL